MCTLIIGYQALGPGSLAIGANRDEDPSRPSDPPMILRLDPRVVGGRDRLAGGTWLAIRERRAVIAMLNRRPTIRQAPPSDRSKPTSPAAPPPPLRSRGLLTLDVASAGEAAASSSSGPFADPLASAALATAFGALRSARYGPFSLAFVAPEACWVLAHEEGTEDRVQSVDAGWHVLTHQDLDDVSEPRSARLLRELRDWKPVSLDDVERGLEARLGEHTAPDPTDPSRLEPPVCIHEGRMVTVSCSVVCWTPHETRYRHVEGRPCERPFEDRSGLLYQPSRAVGG